jgi:L-rhamnose mutarotase
MSEDEMPERIVFRMNLNFGQAAEYERRHDEIYPEPITEPKYAGVSGYTILLDPDDHHLFGILIPAQNHNFGTLHDTEIVKRLWAFKCNIMESHPDNSPGQVPLKQVCYLA